MSNCTCGRTTRPPFCDHSHVLTDEQYAERTARLMKLRPQNQPKRTWINDVADSLPEHSASFGVELSELFNDLNHTGISEIDAHACALTAAVIAGNGELAYEIGMNGPLIGTSEREAAKAAAAEIYHRSMLVRAMNQLQLPDRWDIAALSGNDLYLLAGAIVLGDQEYISVLSSKLNGKYDLATIAKICSLTASIGKIAP